ncbi:unnamed protein product, partial [marine sediment metagenome]
MEPKMNPRRQDWDRLIEICDEAGLPTPVIRPSRLADSWQITIDGHYNTGSPQVCQLLREIEAYALGYRKAMSVSFVAAELDQAKMEWPHSLGQSRGPGYVIHRTPDGCYFLDTETDVAWVRESL